MIKGMQQGTNQEQGGVQVWTMYVQESSWDTMHSVEHKGDQRGGCLRSKGQDGQSNRVHNRVPFTICMNLATKKIDWIFVHNGPS